MSKFTSDGLTRSGKGCFSCTHMATVGDKGFKLFLLIIGQSRSHSRRSRTLSPLCCYVSSV